MKENKAHRQDKLTLLEHAKPTPRVPRISSTPGVELHFTG